MQMMLKSLKTTKPVTQPESSSCKDRLATLGLSNLEKKLRGELLALCSSLKAEGGAASSPGNRGHNVWEWHSCTRGGSGWTLVKMSESRPAIERPSGRGG